jgi:hypothetical protein
MNKIEQLKSEGHYYQAGREARIAGKSDYYGCHYGMRSSCQRAHEEFKAGWQAADDAERLGDCA